VVLNASIKELHAKKAFQNVNLKNAVVSISPV